MARHFSHFCKCHFLTSRAGHGKAARSRSREPIFSCPQLPILTLFQLFKFPFTLPIGIGSAIILIIVKIQLTKDKTIELNFPGSGGSGGSKSKADLVGVELFSDSSQGCPAVRLYRKKNAWRLGAVGYVKAPDGVLPEKWEDVSKQPSWEMPRDFQAPHAALAVNSAMGSFGQASTEAIIQEMMHGIAIASEPAPSAGEPGKRRLGLKSSKAPEPAPKAVAEVSTRRPEFPQDGVPVSENGRRFVVRPFAEEDFHLCASLPEFQSLWLGRLLPEGKRPTANSIQLAESALMASVLAQPEFIASEGNILAIFVLNNGIYFAGYKQGEPVLWRRCPNAQGYLAMREAVKKTLGVDEELIDSVLEDSLIDPRPALEPFIHPVLEQLDLARAYLSGKHQMNVDKVLLLGLPCGAEHWRHYAEEALKIQMIACDPFDGIQIDKGVELTHSTSFMVALGAALAASEVES